MRSLLLGVILMCLAVRAQAMTINLDEYVFQAACNNPIGLIHISVSGGTAPYTFLWSDGSILEDRDNLPPNEYSVTVTDDLGATETAYYSVVGSPMLIVQLTQAESMPCPNEANGSFIVIQSEFSGLDPYSMNVQVNGTPVSQSGVDMWGNPMFAGVASGDVVVISATDALGCAGGTTQIIYGPEDTPVVITNIQGECVGTLGHASISAPFVWSTDLSVWNDQDQVVYHQPDFLNGGTVGGLAAGDYTIKQTWSGIYMVPCDTLYFPLTVPYMGNLCGTVQGSSWYDVDADCVHDANEVGIPYSPLLLEPGAQVALTNGAGLFTFPLANGAYTLAQADATLIPICPSGQPVPFTVNSNIQSISLANGSTVPLDLSIIGSHGQARPGFATAIHALVRNLSPQLSGAVTATITIDPLLVFQSASPTPTSVTGNTVNWDFPAMNSFTEQSLHVQATVPVGTTLGTMLACSGTVSNGLPEGTLANNSFGVGQSVTQVVTGSFDPNDKIARTSSGWSQTMYYIDQDEWIDYAIRFQNTGTDTAFTVLVTDTVGPVLDLLSFEQGASSHPFSVSFKPGGVIEWRFANILLPDSNTNEAASHGLISFRIKPILPLMAGTLIENTANIFFDFNDPVITEPSVLTAEFSTGVNAFTGTSGHIEVLPNPAEDHITTIRKEEGTATAVIRAADGRVVRTERLQGKIGTLDIHSLSVGTYLIEVKSESGTSITRFAKY
ncbi:MAG: T9SS type A sorting domain-containing protein [Flavobacteriales bacterium]